MAAASTCAGRDWERKPQPAEQQDAEVRRRHGDFAKRGEDCGGPGGMPAVKDHADVPAVPPGACRGGWLLGTKFCDAGGKSRAKKKKSTVFFGSGFLLPALLCVQICKCPGPTPFGGPPCSASRFAGERASSWLAPCHYTYSRGCGGRHCGPISSRSTPLVFVPSIAVDNYIHIFLGEGGIRA